MMPKIKFSHNYFKLQCMSTTTLLQVLIADRKELSKSFVEYDTSYQEASGPVEYYPLPDGKLLVLIFKSGSWLFTTIRRWTPEKETYYRGLQGMEFEIVMTSDQAEKGGK